MAAAIQRQLLPLSINHFLLRWFEPRTLGWEFDAQPRIPPPHRACSSLVVDAEVVREHYWAKLGISFFLQSASCDRKISCQAGVATLGMCHKTLRIHKRKNLSNLRKHFSHKQFWLYVKFLLNWQEYSGENIYHSALQSLPTFPEK